MTNGAPELLKGTVRRLVIPTCSLSADDLRRLYAILEGKAREAADRQVASLSLPSLAAQTGAVAATAEDQLQQLRDTIRAALRLVVQVQSGSGEWIGGTTAQTLSDSSLPDSIARIDYDSGFLFKNQTGQVPANYVAVTLDFRRIGILDLTNPSGEPTSNESTALIGGNDITWVNGVYEELDEFFRGRAKPYNWLHSHYIYDLLLVLIGFPSSFAWVYRIDKWLNHGTVQAPSALFVAFYVYVILLVLYAFRLLFNYARWVFPRVEGPERRHRGPWKHRAVLGSLALGLLSAALYDLLKVIL